MDITLLVEFSLICPVGNFNIRGSGINKVMGKTLLIN